jgi:N-acetyl-anhydromuramyl-L-alanine amidase AmpD
MGPETFYFSLSGHIRPNPFPIQEQRVPGYHWYDVNRARSRGGHPINKVTTVVIHATAGWATQHALDRWKEVKASAHWIIPDEDEPQHGHFVWSVVSESLAAYHVRDDKTHPDLGNERRVNDYSLGIEIVNTQDVQNYKDPYSDWQMEQAAQLVRYCWAKYPNLEHVISHARLDAKRRADPGSNFVWPKFKRLIVASGNDPRPVALARATKPVSAFPQLEAVAGAGGCSP